LSGATFDVRLMKGILVYCFVYYNFAMPKKEACGSLDILSIFEALTNSWSPELS
jgi:hypothetical protein